MKVKRLFPMQRSFVRRSVVMAAAVFLVAAFVFVLPGVAWAQDTVAQNSRNVGTFASAAGISGGTDLVTIIGRIVQIFLAVLGIILILLIIYGGWIWMSAAGDDAKILKAKKIITNAIIGVIIVASSFAIATFVMNALRGAVGGGGGGGVNIPGGPNDWNRSMIGRGPIESVYPAPNQKDVSIDTQIAVTFKELIDATTVFDQATGKITDNVEICQVDEDSYGCLASSTMGIADYRDTIADLASDGRTFVFMPNKYLGLNDGNNRIFKVKLKSGINKVSGESVFKGGYYEWIFQTNGKVDLNPPRVIASNVYPVPDTAADSYDLIDQPATGQAVIGFAAADISPDVPLRMGASTSTMQNYVGGSQSVQLNAPAGDIPTEFKLYLKTDSGFNVSSSMPTAPTAINFSVNANATGISVSGNGATQLGLSSADLPISGNRVNFGNGLYLETSGGPFQGLQGTSWRFYLSRGSSGGAFFIAQSSSTVYRYVFVESSDNRDKVVKGGKEYLAVKSSSTPAGTLTNLASRINGSANSLVEATASGSNLTVKAKYAGAAGNAISVGKSENSLQNLTGGVSRAWGRSASGNIKGVFDPYNNSAFQITFSKPINPISITSENVIVRYDSNGDGSLDQQVMASTSISNQYRTITLKGPYECGKNSCGDTVTCWSESVPSVPTSTRFEIEIAAAKLRTCEGANDSWCGISGADSAGFGGSCVAGGRCVKSQDGQTVYYSKTSDPSSGIADMSGNSLNGNYDSYAYSVNGSNYTLGISQGRSGACTDGCSLWPAYVLATSTPSASTSTGDSIKWSFFLSSEIDTASPLVRSISPKGGDNFGMVDGEQANNPVELSFDRLMDSSSFRPGYGYSTSTESKGWFTRYFLLNTLTQGANPIGYWVSKAESDTNNDGWADATKALVAHNNFDNSVQYGPLAGSGIRSITQNCFLPGSGPKYAADASNPNSSNTCSYTSPSATSTSGCVSDADLGDQQVVPTNPASFAYMQCSQIEGAVECTDQAKTCKPFYNTDDTNVSGSWIITNDHPSAVNGRTGCCFGRCQ